MGSPTKTLLQHIQQHYNDTSEVQIPERPRLRLGHQRCLMTGGVSATQALPTHLQPHFGQAELHHGTLDLQAAILRPVRTQTTDAMFGMGHLVW